VRPRPLTIREARARRGVPVATPVPRSQPLPAVSRARPRVLTIREARGMGAAPAAPAPHAGPPVIPTPSVLALREGAARRIVVCGLGPSMRVFAPHRDRVALVVGVNDIDRWLAPDVLVVVDARTRFQGERLAAIENTRARQVWVKNNRADWQWPATAEVLRYDGRHANRDATRITDLTLPWFQSISPVPALCIAVRLALMHGITNIGLVGADLIPKGQPGSHHSSKWLDVVDPAIGAIARLAAAQGVEVVNLSPVSRLTTLPKRSLERWLMEEAHAA
jgi:hypothetical protein